MKWLSVLGLSYFVVFTLGVKHELFKDCNQSGFCARNRFFARQISKAETDSPYFVDSESVVRGQDSIEAVIGKILPNGNIVKFNLQILLLVDDNVRFTVTEERKVKRVGILNTNRFDGTAAAAFGRDPRELTTEFTPKLTKNDKEISFDYGRDDSLCLVLSFKPIKLTIYKDNQPVVVLNDNQFLNIEHYRRKEENHEHLNPELETAFDMFLDSFRDSIADSVPLGPEAIAVDVTLAGFTHAYGIPEHADSLSLKSTTDTPSPYRLFNVDIFEYETDSRMPMYGQIPLLVGIKADTSVGVFWLNSADTFVDIKKSESVNAHWISENGILDVVLLVGDSPNEITSKFGILTGNMPLPQKFALGYHQCRWNYVSEQDLLDVHSQMDSQEFPYDTIWLDVEYTDKKKYFTWDKAMFPKHINMMKQLDETGRNLVVIIDPHLKTSYEVSNYVIDHKLAMLDSKGEPYKGHCWPGESVWIDSLNPESQAYWDELFRNSSDSFIGQESNVNLWNDMNEPSVFNGPETSAPRDNLHYNGWEHRSIHNLWGKSFHELTYNSLVLRSKNSSRQRPFILTRSFFAGSQRTAAMWTGDNMAKWEYLKISIPMLLNSNLVNMPFSGADVGGFFGDPTEELLTRWYQTGIWYPFFRAHAHIDSRRREPYLLKEPYKSTIRDAVRLRYALLPTLYTLFHESSITSAPLWEPMFFSNPTDVNTYEIDDQFFLGNSGIMIKPVTDEAANRVSIYVPQDGETYYDYTNGQLSTKSNGIISKSGFIEREVDLKDIPMYLRGGSIITRQDRYRRSSKLMKRDPYTLVVALSKLGSASGSLYLDDGESFDYQDGEFVKVDFTAYSGNTITSEVKTAGKNFAKTLENIYVERIIVAGVSETVVSVLVDSDGNSWEANFAQSKHIIEIKRPKVGISKTWSIKMVTVAIHDEL